jgi:hypothetical protein
MELNPGIEAVRKLAHMGYRFTVSGDTIKANYKGQGDPDPVAASPLIDLVRQHKEDVHFFLKCFCPRCGGVVFCPDPEEKSRCLACDWEYLTSIYPDIK